MKIAVIDSANASLSIVEIEDDCDDIESVLDSIGFNLNDCSWGVIKNIHIDFGW